MTLATVRFGGFVPIGDERITVNIEIEVAPPFSMAQASVLAQMAASQFCHEVLPTVEQLRQTTAVINDAIATEAARLERVTAETNQAYTRVCDQLAMAYDRIAALERGAEINSVILNGHNLSDSILVDQLQRLKSSHEDLQRRVDAHGSMVNSYSNWRTGADSVFLSIQQRLAALETPEPAAKSRARKKATGKKAGKYPKTTAGVLSMTRKKRGE